MPNFIRCYQHPFLSRPVPFGLRLSTHPSRFQVNTTRLTHYGVRPPTHPFPSSFPEITTSSIPRVVRLPTHPSRLHENTTRSTPRGNTMNTTFNSPRGVRLPIHPSRLQKNSPRLNYNGVHSPTHPSRSQGNTTSLQNNTTRLTYDGRTLNTTGAKPFSLRSNCNLTEISSYWTIDDLKKNYNITVSRQDAATFFGQAVLPVPPHHPELLDKLTADEMTNDESYQVVRHMDLAMDPTITEKSAVDDFAMCLLRAMGYSGRESGRDLRTGKHLSLFFRSVLNHLEADVCVLDKDEFILLVQANKRHKDSRTIAPEPLLIFRAIAAVLYNNHRRRHLGLDPVDVNVMAGISMTGTSPVFFKVPVTLGLIEAVRTRRYPVTVTPTDVAVHYPELPRPSRRLTEGMRPLDNRRSILACYEGFKQFVN
jgi:hypothetical protein